LTNTIPMEAGLSKWDEFWKGMDAVVAQRMDQIADIVMSEFPDAVPIFKYNMPGFKRNGNLIHFNAYRHHIGIYPVPIDDETLGAQLKPFLSGRGTMKILHSMDLPEDLIRAVLRYNAARLDQKRIEK